MLLALGPTVSRTSAVSAARLMGVTAGRRVSTGAVRPAAVARVIQSPCSATALEGVRMIGRLGLPELVVILFIIIMILGANRLPEISRGIGKGIRNFKESNAEGSKRDDD